MTSAKMRVGETFEGPSKTLTDAHFLLFSGLTGDVHPSHYDAEYAKQTRFKKPIAHELARTCRNARAFGDTESGKGRIRAILANRATISKRGDG